jgi:hypothetical protein
MLVGQIGRDRGYALQDRLFAMWSGIPTTVMLRHKDSPFDEATLAKLHAWLASVTGVPAPSKRKEAASPEDADEVYYAFTRHMRDETRDKQKYPLVFEENVSYGFRRNTWGLKPFGITAASVGTIGAAVNIYRFKDGPSLGMAVACTALSALLLLFWLCWVHPSWVKIPAKAYAERMVEAALRLARTEPKGSTSKANSSPPEKTPKRRAVSKASRSVEVDEEGNG